MLVALATSPQGERVIQAVVTDIVGRVLRSRGLEDIPAGEIDAAAQATLDRVVSRAQASGDAFDAALAGAGPQVHSAAEPAQE